jgi:hypothetical protein
VTDKHCSVGDVGNSDANIAEEDFISSDIFESLVFL